MESVPVVQIVWEILVLALAIFFLVRGRTKENRDQMMSGVCLLGVVTVHDGDSMWVAAVSVLLLLGTFLGYRRRSFRIMTAAALAQVAVFAVVFWGSMYRGYVDGYSDAATRAESIESRQLR